MPIYCEHCGAELLISEEIGRADDVARPCGMIGERAFVTVYICQGCVDQEQQDMEDAMGAGDFDIDIEFQEWVEREAKPCFMFLLQ